MGQTFWASISMTRNTGAQSTSSYEIIWVELARLEDGPRPGFKFRPVGPPSRPNEAHIIKFIQFSNR